jgi:hypothetical protein
MRRCACDVSRDYQSTEASRARILAGIAAVKNVAADVAQVVGAKIAVSINDDPIVSSQQSRSPR